MTTVRRLGSGVGREPLFGIASTRRIEREAATALPRFSLMTRAGDSIARLAMAISPHADHIVVHAGPGNNGGDGLAAATCLRRMGKNVTVRLFAEPSTLPADAANAWSRAVAAGVPIAIGSDAGSVEEAPAADLVVDALLGIGASRPPAAEIAAAIGGIARARQRGSRILAVDVPSGLDVERGQPIGDACVVADDTLTLLTAKAGLFTSAGRDHAGRVWFDRLATHPTSAVPDAWLVGRGELSRLRRPRLQAEHKGSFGDVAIVGGAGGMTGAALLAARAAHAAGAGRVFLDLIGDVDGGIGVDMQRPELMLRRGWWQGPIEAISMTTVVCGCGGGDAIRATLPRLLALAPRLLLDADALNAVAADRSLQVALTARAARSLDTVLTPHPLEAARLLDTTAPAVQADRLAAAAALADRYRCVIVLKGSGSIVTSPGGPPFVNATGNASLATAGTGDVLAGWIGGRWRSAMSAIDVAVQGVVEHGAAAEPEAPGALRAGDLIEALYRFSRATY